MHILKWKLIGTLKDERQGIKNDICACQNVVFELFNLGDLIYKNIRIGPWAAEITEIFNRVAVLKAWFQLRKADAALTTASRKFFIDFWSV